MNDWHQLSEDYKLFEKNFLFTNWFLKDKNRFAWLIIYDILEDSLKIALANIGKCFNSISLKVSLSDHFTETDFFKTNTCIINVEDALLDLGSSKVVDGIFYCCVMRVDLAETPVPTARFFECGAFNHVVNFIRYHMEE